MSLSAYCRDSAECRRLLPAVVIAGHVLAWAGYAGAEPLVSTDASLPDIVLAGRQVCSPVLERPDYLECLFRQAMKAKRQRRYREAIRYLRQMLAVDPSLARVRLELATCYFRIGNDEQAERHFRYALGTKLPPVVVQRVMAYLDAIRKRRNWVLSFDFSVVPQSNVNNATKARVITAGGIPWTLTDDSRQKAGLRVNASGSLLVRPYLTQDLRGHLKIAPSISASTDGDFDFRNWRVNRLSFASWSFTLDGEAGLVLLADRQEISFGLSAGHTWYEGESYLWTYGFWVRGLRELTARTMATAAFSLKRLDYDPLWTQRDGWEISFTPGLRHQLTPSLAVSGHLPMLWHEVEPKDKAYASYGVSVGADYILPWDLSLYASAQITRRRYHADDPIFGKRRKDWKLRLSTRLTWARWKAFDLAPYLEYSYERQDSTLILDEYENHAVMIGLTKTF